MINRRTLDTAEQLRRRVDAIADSVTRSLTASWADAWAEIEAEWDAAITQIIHQSADGVVTPAMVMRMERAQRALQVTAEALQGLADGLGEVTTEPLNQILAASGEYTERIVQAQLPTGARISFNRADGGAIEAIVRRATEQITSPNPPLSDEALVAVRSSLLRGVPAGWGPDKAAQRMMSLVSGAFAGGLTRAMTIARTELLDAHRAATKAAEKANPDAVAGWVWLAELDSRTCPACIAMNGTVHDTDEDMLAHQNCRCTRVTKAKSWSDLGFPNLDEPDDLTPDSEAWFDNLSAAEQTNILGPAKFSLYQSGQVGIRDMATLRPNANWRDSWGAPTVNDLLASI